VSGASISLALLRPRAVSMTQPDGRRSVSHARLTAAFRCAPESLISYRKSAPLLAVGGLILRVRHDYARRAGQ
jgi:hypothetical protein